MDEKNERWALPGGEEPHNPVRFERVRVVPEGEVSVPVEDLRTLLLGSRYAASNPDVNDLSWRESVSRLRTLLPSPEPALEPALEPACPVSCRCGGLSLVCRVTGGDDRWRWSCDTCKITVDGKEADPPSEQPERCQCPMASFGPHAAVCDNPLPCERHPEGGKA